MILELNSLDSIASTTYTHITVMLNTDGLYSAPGVCLDLSAHSYAKDSLRSFAGFLSKSDILPELRSIGKKELGEVIEIRKGDITYYGMVCYELSDKHRTNTPASIALCLEKIKTEEPIAHSLEASLIKMANITTVMHELERANVNVVVYK